MEQDKYYLTLHINAGILPEDRKGYYEEPIDYALRKMGIGEVTGANTCLSENGEPVGCEIDILLNEASNGNYSQIQSFIEFLGVPKGSWLKVGEQQLKIGNLEGIAVYLNGTDLEDDVYKNCDVNFVIEELLKILGDELKFYSYWEGKTETALYFYGKSAAQMKKLIMPFINTYPLCEKSRICENK